MSEQSHTPRGIASDGAIAAPGSKAHLLSRGVPALLVGLATTFTGGHSPLFGLVAVAAWGIAGGIADGVAVARMPLPQRVRGLQLARAATVLAVGVLAAVLSTAATAAALVYLVGVGAILAGGLDTAAGILARRRLPLARDWMLLGGATLLLGVLALVVPPGFRQPFPGAGGDPGVLTASTIVVGFFGAWGIVVGVLALIAAAGERTGAEPAG
ncbi:MAG: hypothetical protein HY996_12160 [Micrococcales bacterium]|nr:hypothetical protein [Micrococcales bacterium]